MKKSENGEEDDEDNEEKQTRKPIKPSYFEEQDEIKKRQV